jgi:hypothetical protein
MVKAGKRVAIYCRVSTKDKGQTTENQRLASAPARFRSSRMRWLRPERPHSELAVAREQSPPFFVRLSGGRGEAGEM